MEHEELAGWLRLTLTAGIGDMAARRLLAAFGLPPAIFAQPAEALCEVVTPAQAQALQRRPAGLDDQIAQTWAWLQTVEAEGVARRIVTLADADYPVSLLETADPPALLYVIGAARFTLTDLARSIAIVGSRNPTPQGASNAQAFGRAFAELGIPVVSGLALGVDGAAHQGALDGAPADALATVAVVGTGLDRVYPARHRTLAHHIARQGLIVSEFALGTPPLNQNFPKRNRIIAGLSQGTLVVEAALKSGSLITARMASEQGREVFAIPGSIHSAQSRGCHALIRQGAKLVESVQDVLEELPQHGATTPSATNLQSQLHDADGEMQTTEENSVLNDIGFDPVSLDALCARTGFTPAALQAKLLEFELDGHIARLPGGLFQRVVQG